MILLVGHSGSGKDTIQDIFKEHGFEPVVSCTTRPPRDYEVEGVHYHFIDEVTFKTLLKVGYFFEYQIYRDWYYGTSTTSIGDNKVIIVAPEGMKQFMNKLSKVVVIHVKADEEVRRKRLHGRGDNEEEIERRIVNDRRDFKDVEAYAHFTILNNTDDKAMLHKNVSSFIEMVLKPYMASR